MIEVHFYFISGMTDKKDVWNMEIETSFEIDSYDAINLIQGFVRDQLFKEKYQGKVKVYLIFYKLFQKGNFVDSDKDIEVKKAIDKHGFYMRKRK